MKKPSILAAKWVAVLLLVMALGVPVTGVIAVQALRTAQTAACKGGNEAKTAVTTLFHILVTNAERPIPDATPAQIARQQASIKGYEQFKALSDKQLAATNC